MRLAIGTVQLGKRYGISNTIGQTTVSEMRKILNAAKDAGISMLDTASSYGDSEKRLGHLLAGSSQFDIVTKTPYLKTARITPTDIEIMEKAFENSLLNLQKECIYGLLVHNVDNLSGPGGDKLYGMMQKLKQEKKVQKIGVSVYTGQEIDSVLGKYPVDIVQLPINIFDQRLIKSGHLKKLKSRGVEIHARSVFLQGLLLMAPDRIPDYFSSVRPVIENLEAMLKKNGMTRTEGALQFVKNIREIDRILVGVNTAQQLKENVEAYNSDGSIDFTEFAINNGDILNPSKWKL